MKTKKILKELVKINFRIQKKLGLNAINTLGVRRYIQEIATIKLKNARRSGHTEAGLSLAKKYPIIYITQDNKKLILKSKYYKKYKANIKVFTTSGQYSDFLRGVYASQGTIIIIDRASDMEQIELESYAKQLPLDGRSCIILLG